MKTVQTENKFSDVVEQLVKACREQSGLDPRDVLVAIEDPQWADASRTNDWRNYVDEEIIAVWGQLSLDAKLVAYMQGAAGSVFDD